jgi:DNA invertase Pin-like site-specific DNA recombinase
MSTRTIRCAVYTRKSSEEGLEQAFNSLDAQREAGLDYIKSQKHQGWLAVNTAYDDGGYSGGSMERPGLQRLLADISAGRIDVVLVYKVDRLSRSLADFARLMQVFDEHRVSFVSVTQQFNTTTSMGRLTLNMLLSFAQFEREVAGERIRDKIAATKRKGVWVCGQPPLGYRLTPGSEDRCLQIIETEARLVRLIYATYLETGSVLKTVTALNAAGHRTKVSESSRGNTRGDRPLSTIYIYRILNNPIYIGKLTHTRLVNGDSQTDVIDAQHQPIVDRSLWDRVQSMMKQSKRDSQHRWTHTHLLKGKLRTSEDYAMSPASVQRVVRRDGKPTKERRLVRYYVSQKAIKLGYASCPIKTINAARLDELVRAVVLDHLRLAHKLDLAAQPSEACDHWVRAVLDRVVLSPDSVQVQLDHDQIDACRAALVSNNLRQTSDERSTTSSQTCPFTPEVEATPRGVMLTLRLQIKRLDGKRMLLSPEGHDLVVSTSPNAHEHIRAAIGRAFAFTSELLRSGEDLSVFASRNGLSDSWLNRLLVLTRLSPEILKHALLGTLPPGVGLDDLMAAAQRLDWSSQAKHLGL